VSDYAKWGTLVVLPDGARFPDDVDTRCSFCLAEENPNARIRENRTSRPSASRPFRGACNGQGDCFPFLRGSELLPFTQRFNGRPFPLSSLAPIPMVTAIFLLPRLIVTVKLITHNSIQCSAILFSQAEAAG
jgi:hypothetical protein